LSEAPRLDPTTWLTGDQRQAQAVTEAAPPRSPASWLPPGYTDSESEPDRSLAIEPASDDRSAPSDRWTLPGTAPVPETAATPRSLVEAIRVGDEDALAGFREAHAGSVQAFCATVFSDDQLYVVIDAAFLDFAARVRQDLTVEAADDLGEILLKATRSAAAGRVNVTSAGDCAAVPELLAARANGELPNEPPLSAHLASCPACAALDDRLRHAERRFREAEQGDRAPALAPAEPEAAESEPVMPPPQEATPAEPEAAASQADRLGDDSPPEPAARAEADPPGTTDPPPQPPAEPQLQPPAEPQPQPPAEPQPQPPAEPQLRPAPPVRRTVRRGGLVGAARSTFHGVRESRRRPRS
jgi:hypothetical protein